VFDRLSKRFGSVVIAGLVAAGAMIAQKAPAVKDQGEYDAIQAVQKEKDPQKQLDLLKVWEQKYPQSDFAGQRQLSIAQAESQVAAKGLAPNAAAGDQDAAQKAAQDLVQNLDTYLAPANKPANATEDQWKQAHTQIEEQAHLVLATISSGKKDDPKAEEEYKKVLAIDPNNAAAAYSLGTLIYRSKNVMRFSEAFFWIARSLQISGPAALNPAGKQAAEKFLRQAYSGYHGNDMGIDDLMKTASSSPSLPPNFHIDSAVEIANKEAGDAEAFAKAHPDIALWRKIRDALTAADGDTYFMQIKGSEIPPQEGADFKKFTAKVVMQTSPKELLLNLDNAAGDVTLRFENALKGTIEPGTEVKFKGVVEEFKKDPYNLVLTIEDPKEDVEGIPASAFAGAPAPTKKRTPAKKK
jgi:Tfp pilus assembly protein PilF